MIIPEMTDPMGKHWSQPDRNGIDIDDTHALMSESQIAELKDYSRSIPTGAYEGKMWKFKDSLNGKWSLCWYGESEGPGMLSFNQRIILEV